MRFSLGNDLSHRYSSTSLVHLCPLVSYASVCGNRQCVVQVPIMDAILMGYWVSYQLRTMMSSVMYKSKFRIRFMILRRVLVFFF